MTSDISTSPETRSRVASERPLCVDLDGTLIATDLLWESLLSAVRLRPWIVAVLPVWLVSGRAHLKQRLAEAARIEFSTLPYRRSVVQFVTAARDTGRPVVLATAADGQLAAGVAAHLGLFAEVMSSDGAANLKGTAKAEALVSRFGARNFDYLGDSHADVPCWRLAHDAISAGVMPTRQVPHLRALAAEAGAGRRRLEAVVRALRPHQWLKNALLVVPAVAGHRLQVSVLLTLAVAFACVSLVASGGYILNDLLDLSADRRHARKRHRPFAAGRLTLPTGLAMIAACWTAGFGIALLMLPLAFAGILAVYLVATAAYSLHVKKVAVLDVMFLAGLYVLRVVAGGIAISLMPSTWLLTFTLFVCLSLALLKRYIETSRSTAVVPGRGYVPADAGWLQAAGLAAAYLSVLVLAIYVNSDDVRALYSHPERLLLMCPILLYWATAVWFDAHRGVTHDDPLVAVATDRTTYVLGVLSAIVVTSAS